MLAQDFVNKDGGYATCLRNMQTAVEQGAAIDFSSWGEAAKKLIHLERQTLDALIDLYSEFHAARCEAGQKKSTSVGIKSGRKKLVLPDNFEEEVSKWIAGDISSKEAAKHCGMALSTFYVKVKERSSETQTPEMIDSMVNLWIQRKVTSKEAALKLGITTRAFTKILHARGAKRGYTPEAFDRYYELFQKGILTKEEAAVLCGVTAQHFTCCINKLALHEQQKEVMEG